MESRIEKVMRSVFGISGSQKIDLDFFKALSLECFLAAVPTESTPDPWRPSKII